MTKKNRRGGRPATAARARGASGQRAQAEREAREARMAALRREQTRRERRRLVLIVLAAVLAVALVVTVVVAIVRSGDQGKTFDEMAGVEVFEPTRNHVTGGVTYEQTPPAGGDHNRVWLNCGVYDEAVPNENAVHSLEHGAVWVTYRPDLPATDVEALAEALPETYVILSPYPDLPAPVVASAWGRQLRLEGADDPRLAEFVRTYREGPQTPEPGAPCTGGVDASGQGSATGMS
jgi:hypothetical protein